MEEEKERKIGSKRQLGKQLNKSFTGHDVDVKFP